MTNCQKCGWRLTELFLSQACDRCDGLLTPKQEVTQEASSWCWLPADNSSVVLRKRTMLFIYPSLAATKKRLAATFAAFQRTIPPGVFMRIAGPADRTVASIIWTEDQRQFPDDRFILQYFVE